MTYTIEKNMKEERVWANFKTLDERFDTNSKMDGAWVKVVSIKGSKKGCLNPMFGLKHTEETKAKISKANKGRTVWLGRKHKTESKIKISIAKLGKPLSETTKQKMSLVRTGKKFSAETRRKMSEKAKIREQRKRDSL